MNIKSVVLLILDGWGYARPWGGNAITIAQTPNYDKLLRKFPNTLILASGEAVGLPGEEVGNSEVGHMNLGAGSVVRQDISRINDTVVDGSFYKNKTLLEAIKRASQGDSAVHLMGIISDGGIHSHIIHLFALLKMCKDNGAKKVYIHAFTDGRDTEPYSSIEFANQINSLTNKLQIGQIATVAGRFYLDRRGEWSRTEKVYRAIVERTGNKEKSALSGISNAYKRGESDEFIIPFVVEGTDGAVKDGDTVIFFNFRSDRTRQLTKALLDKNFKEFEAKRVNNLEFISFIPYGIEKELGVTAKTAFPALQVEHTLAKFISEKKLAQFHIAETEKYAHVTYFFNGNVEQPYPQEERMIIPSPNVLSYAEKPEMSAEEIKNSLIKNIKFKRHNFIVCNFANGDMVGHTGNFDAAVKAVEFLDKKIKEIADVCVDRDVPLIITADHGNIEQMVDPSTGYPYTEHTKNPVPFIVVSSKKITKIKQNLALANVAESCLKLMAVESNGLFKESIIDL
ncbi:MAG: 2,3-bisphosphoglycerate-independent phosphoglycerate mutase [Candidatus Berkelbacteria bacterium]|nr:2,3-bisphosphoglycerate-independent phosphoglycerate mutase [Candidatus Berkelbacteria bacterium]